jgi:uncharacterized protein YktA (UPF0223 family)
MSNQSGNNNNTTSNDFNDAYEGLELFEEDIKKAELAKESNKRARDDSDNDNEEPEHKRQREDNWNESEDVSSESSSETSDSVSDDGEVSETERINTKYSKRFDAIEDYKEKNKLLSEKCVEDVMNKLDRDEELSTQELETLNRAFRLMDKTIPNDVDSLERMQLYEAFSGIVPSEISENNERIGHHEKKISEYLARLEELNQGDNNNDSSSSDSNSNDNTNNNPNNSYDSPDPNDDDDGSDDFPPSFDFDDF